MKKVIIILLIMVVIAAGAYFFAFQREKQAEDSIKSALANPASVNCIEQGGKLEIRESKLGQYGVCIFEDNRQCEEWALLRGQCPTGGMKITGYQNEAEVYCAITGGELSGLDTSTPMCQRVDGTFCNAEANLNGECPNPNDPNPSAGNREVP
jgi:putative hemolysin